MFARRPAHRIPAVRLAWLRAQAQAKSDAVQQRMTPTPEFVPAPRLSALPGGLHWSAPQAIPGIGATVTVQQGGAPKALTVLAYCHAAGFLGLVTEPQQKDKKGGRKQHPRNHCIFGSQLAHAA